VRVRNLLSIADLKKEDIEELLRLSDEIKEKVFPQTGKHGVLLFNRPSTRTVVSFEAALGQLGYGAIRLEWVFSQAVRGEAVRDTAKTLSQFSSLIIARLYPHAMLAELAAHAAVPVISAASDLEHPCQALGDMLTIKQNGKLKKGNKVVFVGDPVSNVANSLMLACVKLGLDFVFLCPEGYAPRQEYFLEGDKLGAVTVAHDIGAVKDAAVIYTSAWVGPALEEESPLRMKELLPYQVNAAMLGRAPDDVIVMHPLPAFRGLEIADAVLDGKNSVVWAQTRNRLYIQKAIIRKLMV